MAIPSFKIEFSDNARREILGKIDDVLRSGWLSIGAVTKEFEDLFSTSNGRKFATACSSGSIALELIFRGLGFRGRKVLVPTNTNFATAASAVYAGARISFYDGGLYPDVDDIARQIDDETAAIVVVHIGGYISLEIDRLIELCSQKGVALIEDGAHAHYAELDGRLAGSFGVAAAYSFFPTKVITTGEGGAVITDSSDLHGVMNRLRNQGASVAGDLHDLWGNSWRMSEIDAAVGITQLREISQSSALRVGVVQRYKENLADLSDHIDVEFNPSRQRPSGYKVIAMLKDRSQYSGLLEYLAGQHITLAKKVYETPLHKQPVFVDLAGSRAFPVADDFAERHVCLPAWTTMSASEIDEVCAAVRKYFELFS